MGKGPENGAVTTAVKGGKLTFTVFPGLCKGCGLCREKCCTKAIGWSEQLGFLGNPTVRVDPELCKGCRTCEVVCPDCAIRVDLVPSAGSGGI